MNSQRFVAILFLIALLGSFLFLLGYAFYGLNYLLFIFIVLFVFLLIFAYLLVKNPKNEKLKALLDLHKTKESLLLQKSSIQKQFLKRQISEKQYNLELLDLDKQLIILDYSIDYFDSKLEDEQDLKRKLKYLQKKLFKQQISENVYNVLQTEISKELAKLDIKD